MCIRDRLVPQDPTDEPASHLLQTIRQEKDRLISEGKIKRDKPLPSIAADEQPFEVPEGWEWVRMGSIGASFDYGTSQKAVENSSAVPILRMGNIQAGRVIMTKDVYKRQVQSYWQVGQIIVEHEQAGQARAAYGARVLQEVASRLSAEFGKGFSVANLRNFRQFYQTFTLDEIRYTPCSELSWSHFRMLMRVPDPTARQWYALEAVSQTWSVAALDRQISTCL